MKLSLDSLTWVAVICVIGAAVITTPGRSPAPTVVAAVPRTPTAPPMPPKVVLTNRVASKKKVVKVQSPRAAAVNAVVVVPYFPLKWDGTAGEKTMVLDAPTPNGPWRLLATTTNTSYDAVKQFSERYYMVQTTNANGFDGSVLEDYVAKHGIPPYQPGYSGRNPMQLYGSINRDWKPATITNRN